MNPKPAQGAGFGPLSPQLSPQREGRKDEGHCLKAMKELEEKNRKVVLSKLNRIVIKVGTSVLSSGTALLDTARIDELVLQICRLLDKRIEVVLVSSGAIGAGMGLLGLKSRPKELPLQQAAAAVGQNQLMKIYAEHFKAQGLLVAQVLLTSEDLADRTRYLNARNTLFTLLHHKAIPIINENDTVAVDEIKFGDNDRLSALVANLVEADLLVILSDVDGLQRFLDEKAGRGGPIIETVNRITPEIERLARDTTKESSLGGMVTKVQAAKVVTASGIPCIIANGRAEGILNEIIQHQNVGTLFLPRADKMKSRKRWIAFTSKPCGKLLVDKGAKEALCEKGKSLLATGITQARGNFALGDLVSIADRRGQEFARGLTNYSSKEVDKIKGLKTEQIRLALGHQHYGEVIHRDNLVIL